MYLRTKRVFESRISQFRRRLVNQKMPLIDSMTRCVYYCVVCLPPLKSCWSAHVSLCSRVYHPLANITALVKVTMWFITNVKLSIILDCLLTTLPDSLSIGQPLQPSPEPFSACLQFSPCFGLIYRCHCPSPGILVISNKTHNESNSH